MSMALSEEQKIDWLQLIRSENVGPRTFRTLINKFGGARAALEALPDLLAKQNMGARAIRLCSRDDVLREYEDTRAAGAIFIALGDPAYPAVLRAIDAPPPLLTVKGDASVLTRPGCAVVGSRNASAAGLAFAERLSRALCKEGLVVVSGLARGIDAAAHQASLSGGTIAVLAGGLNKLYPANHADLAAQIIETGALVTEMPLNAEPRGRDFPRRNRIVSGLSLAVVVVEASRRSGSLITARFAGDQGRPLFAVPGSPLDPRAEGANDLLREGAHFCTRPEDVIEIVRPMIEGPAPLDDLFSEQYTPPGETLWDESDFFGEIEIPRSDPVLDLNEDSRKKNPTPARALIARRVESSADDCATRVVELLGPTPMSLDDLIRFSGAQAGDVHLALLELELEGRILRQDGQMISLTPNALTPDVDGLDR